MSGANELMGSMSGTSDLAAARARLADQRTMLEERAWRRLEAVMDPELPQLSVLDLGMVRFVEALDERAIQIGVSPTYSGCPALRVIHDRIRAALEMSGIARVDIRDVLTPAWTSEWITERGRAILRECGIAPPVRGIVSAANGIAPVVGDRGARRVPRGGAGTIRCPRCDSARTDRVSEFGSTPCKAQYRCLDCLEPFEYFKCI